MLHVYTDGASEPNPGPSAYGYVILADDHEAILAEHVGAWKHSTNQRAELQAITSALLRCQTVEGVTDGVRVYSDSQYALNCLSTWWKKWERQGWRKNKHEPVKNLDIIRAGVEAQKSLVIDWRWVRGHSGVRWNEYVDALVNGAAMSAGESGVVDAGYPDDPHAVTREQMEYEQARLDSLFS